MDQNLINCLNNLSESLEEMAKAISSSIDRNDISTLTSTESTDTISTIAIVVKSIKEDTVEILKNQETILGIAKSKDDKNSFFSGLSGSDDGKSDFLKGIDTVMLIATAVLSMGLAFNLIGSVDFASVIALSISLPLLAIGFAKINKSVKDNGFDPAIDSIVFLIAVTTMSMGLMLSSHILARVTPLPIDTLLTSVGIALAFGLMSHSVGKMVSTFGGFGMASVLMAAISIPILLPSMAYAISLSSKYLNDITTVGIPQLLTAIAVSAVFAIAAYGIKKIVASFSGVKGEDVIFASFAMPVLFAGMSLAIMTSSHLLSGVVGVSTEQIVTSLAISAMFTVLSYGLAVVAKKISEINYEDLAKIPLFFTAMSLSILASSYILSQVNPMSTDQLLSLLSFTILSAASIMVYSGVIWLTGLMGISIEKAFTGSLSILLISGAIMASSLILSYGNYDNYPSWNWALGVGLSIIAFSPAIILLGALSATGVGALAIALGAAMVNVVAASIATSSHILAKGDYSNYPSMFWSMGVATSLTAYTVGMVALGTMLTATFGLGYTLLDSGSKAVIKVSETIADSSHILARGVYDGGPNLSWSSGVALSLGAFAPVYAMLMANKILSIFGGGVKPKDFTDAIKVISEGIVESAQYFAKNKTAFINGPSKEWAEGVGTAIGAFAPVYKVLDDFPRSGGTLLRDAIVTVAEGIIDTANIFALNKTTFDNAYPSQEWGEGVGGALSAFSPVFDALSGKSWYQSSRDVIRNMRDSITVIAKSLVDSAVLISGVPSNVWENYPRVEWSENISNVLSSYMGIYNDLNRNKVDYSKLNTIDRIVGQMSKTAIMIYKGREYFNASIDPNFITNLSSNVIAYKKLIDDLNKNNEFTIGEAFGIDPVRRTVDGMLKMADGYERLAKSVRNFGSSLNVMTPATIESFSRLTGNLALLSAMDSELFNNMLTVIESRSGVFAKLIENQNLGGDVISVSRSNSAIYTNPSNNDNSALEEKLDIMISLLSKMLGGIGSIDNSLQNPFGNSDSNMIRHDG